MTFDGQQAALEYLKRKGVTTSWNWYDVWSRQHAAAFTIAKTVRIEQVALTKAAIEKALADGLTQRQFMALHEELYKRAGYSPLAPWRYGVIYRTNMQAAYSAGRWRAIEALGRPWLQYVAVRDSKTRETHAALDGKIARLDDKVWDKIAPPNGFNCRCRLRPLTSNQAKGIKKLPDGFPDAGFDYNPAKAQDEILAKRLNDTLLKTRDLSQMLASEAVTGFPVTRLWRFNPVGWTTGGLLFASADDHATASRLFSIAETATVEGSKIRLTGRGRKAAFIKIRRIAGLLYFSGLTRSAKKWLN